MSASLSSQLSTWAERHPGAKAWPGDIRPLWTRALERRQYEQRVEAEERLIHRMRKAKENGRKGGRRVHKAIAVGDVFGSFRVIKLLGRGFQGRSDMRVRMECTCGREAETFEYMARLRGNTPDCPHPRRGRP